MKYLVLICRILIGLVFIFSSFVKGVDPLGTTYKINEYMLAFGMPWAQSFSFALSVCLCTLEFLIGVLMLTNACKKLGKWLLLLMMLFFLITTFIDAVTNQVSDCGCFGDAVKLTNWETFWKNVVLMIPTCIIFFGQKTKHENLFFTKPRDLAILISGIVLMISFCLYNFYNEPVLDFRPWKVGNHMMPKERGEVKSYLIYKNKKTGEEMEFSSEKLMDYYKDTAWVASWEFKDSKVIDPNEIGAPGFSMLDFSGHDHAKDLIGNPDFLFIITSYDVTEISGKGVSRIQPFIKSALEEGKSIVFLTASLEETIEEFRKKDSVFEQIDFYLADDKAIKTIMRSNPGLILMKNGTVLGKWHYRNIPDIKTIDFEKLAKKYDAD